MNFRNDRIPEADVAGLFTERWSPRSFRADPVPQHLMMTLFEAARWAPSCFNDQPWYFLYAADQGNRRLYLDLLAEKNRLWASSAPLLIFVLARRMFTHNGRENRHAVFDAGAAWMSLALQARMLGLHAHGMAGFDRERAFEVLGVDPDRYDIMAAVAVGWRDEPGNLPESFRPLEQPNGRNPLSAICTEGRLPDTP